MRRWSSSWSACRRASGNSRNTAPTALGRVGDGILRLALGADEQDAAAFGDGVAHRLQRAMQHRHGLGEIDDVDVVAGAEDVSSPSSDSSGGPDGRSERQLPRADAWKSQEAPLGLLRLIRRGRLRAIGFGLRHRPSGAHSPAVLSAFASAVSLMSLRANIAADLL